MTGKVFNALAKQPRTLYLLIGAALNFLLFSGLIRRRFYLSTSDCFKHGTRSRSRSPILKTPEVICTHALGMF
jgi:hypothetical protein